MNHGIILASNEAGFGCFMLLINANQDKGIVERKTRHQ